VRVAVKGEHRPIFEHRLRSRACAKPTAPRTVTGFHADPGSGCRKHVLELGYRHAGRHHPGPPLAQCGLDTALPVGSNWPYPPQTPGRRTCLQATRGLAGKQELPCGQAATGPSRAVRPPTTDEARVAAPRRQSLINYGGGHERAVTRQAYSLAGRAKTVAGRFFLFVAVRFNARVGGAGLG